MKNIQKEEIPLLNIERSPLVLFISALICALTVYYAYTLLESVNPWGFIVMVPGAILFFQVLWLLVNPFALVFDDKLEIKQSLFHHKLRYFVDIKRISENKKGRIYITYNDDEMEALNLFGIRASHTKLLKTEMEKHIATGLAKRVN